jgi:hypothetical protein
MRAPRFARREVTCDPEYESPARFLGFRIRIARHFLLAGRRPAARAFTQRSREAISVLLRCSVSPL